MKGVNLEGKKVAVIGSRSFSDREKLYSVLTKNKAKIKLIVSGGARGADTLATQWATDYGVPYLVFPALWRNPETLAFDRGAGMRRNRLIVEYADHVIAFWDGISKGTLNSIETAKQLNKPVTIISFESVQEDEAQEPSA
jgi:predicted Rossmann fold nucleotide-binding protein DprA/Smf involved in DNA uptake